jgi:hypothetical protein
MYGKFAHLRLRLHSFKPPNKKADTQPLYFYNYFRNTFEQLLLKYFGEFHLDKVRRWRVLCDHIFTVAVAAPVACERA